MKKQGPNLYTFYKKLIFVKEIKNLIQLIMKPKDSNYDSKIEQMVKRWSGKKIEIERKNHERAENRLETIKNQLTANQSFVMESRKTKVSTRCEVLVVGGGPAGLSAALGSSRAGADTLII